MAYSLIARALGLGVLPAILVAGCVYHGLDPVGGDFGAPPDAGATSSPNSSGNPGTTSNPGTVATPEVQPTGPETLVISEVRSHGTGGDGWGDDFIELFNTGDAPITLDGAWTVNQQSNQGAPCQGLLKDFVGLGQVIPPHGHFLLGGFEYGMGDPAAPPMDSPILLSTVVFSIADASSIWIAHGTKVVDAICFYYDDTTLGYLNQTCALPNQCKGKPLNNLPHDGTNGDSSNVNVSFERIPVGGGLQNTGDNSADFRQAKPATPQNLASPLGP